MTTYNARTLEHIYKFGETGTFTYYTGQSACPCWAHGGTGYNAQWHADNPSATACNGTGKISGTAATINVKGMLFDPNTDNTEGMPKRLVDKIGSVPERAKILMGVVNTDSLAKLDLSTYTLQSAKFTFDSIDYTIIDWIELAMDVLDAVLLRMK